MKKRILLIMYLLGTIVLGYANNLVSTDGLTIHASKGGEEKTSMASSIIANIDGHTLTVVFTENLGQVAIEVSFTGGGEVETTSLYTPSGVIIYIPIAGSYVITFTLPNGDEYYGEFEVTD